MAVENWRLSIFSSVLRVARKKGKYEVIIDINVKLDLIVFHKNAQITLKRSF